MRFLSSLLVVFLTALAFPATQGRVFTDQSGNPVNVVIQPHYTEAKITDPFTKGSISLDVDYQNAPNGACLYVHIAQISEASAANANCKAYFRILDELNGISQANQGVIKNRVATRGHGYKALNNGSGKDTVVVTHEPLSATALTMVQVVAGAFDQTGGVDKLTKPYGETAAKWIKLDANGTPIAEMTTDEVMAKVTAKDGGKCLNAVKQAIEAGVVTDANACSIVTEARRAKCLKARADARAAGKILSSFSADEESEEADEETEESNEESEESAEVNEAGEEFEGEVDEAELDTARSYNTHQRRHQRSRRVSVSVNVEI